ncbi:uncharacterized protein OCT59_011712 [Rhizophagus irregularis]|uniref:uncharacterized protein n=1 Tax=Rhizophagus irregularis TaxID=588596 RepID=UPI00332124A7|nr:hypothetical protein OCT59_011712 [Rhizophagus irregularis]
MSTSDNYTNGLSIDELRNFIKSTYYLAKFPNVKNKIFFGSVRTHTEASWNGFEDGFLGTRDEMLGVPFFRYFIFDFVFFGRIFDSR